jgi:hypothetical protein
MLRLNAALATSIADYLTLHLAMIYHLAYL